MTREEFPGLQVSVSVLCNFEVSPWKVFLLRKSYTSGWSWLCRLGSGDSWDQNWVSEWKREQEDSHFFARGWFPSSQMRDVNWLQVPLAQGWDKIQTIDSLLRKGGWRGQVLQFCVWKYRGSANWCILFYRTRVRSLGMLVSNSLTHWRTDWLLFSKLDWCDSGMWRWQLKTCCYCCWGWWWETCRQQFGADLEGELWS